MWHRTTGVLTLRASPLTRMWRGRVPVASMRAPRRSISSRAAAEARDHVLSGGSGHGSPSRRARPTSPQRASADMSHTVIMAPMLAMGTSRPLAPSMHDADAPCEKILPRCMPPQLIDHGAQQFLISGDSHDDIRRHSFSRCRFVPSAASGYVHPASGYVHPFSGHVRGSRFDVLLARPLPAVSSGQQHPQPPRRVRTRRRRVRTRRGVYVPGGGTPSENNENAPTLAAPGRSREGWSSLGYSLSAQLDFWELFF